MSRQNIIFGIIAPLVLMAIIATIVISVGETLLAVHRWAQALYYVGAYPTPEENRYWDEIAALYPVGVALAIAALFLIGGSVVSRLLPQRAQSRGH